MSIELRDLLRSTRRWWWLLLVVPLLGAAISYMIGSILPRRYDATATVLVTPSRDGGVVVYDDLQAGSQLAATYAYLAQAKPMLISAAEALGEPDGGDVELGNRVSTRVVAELPVIEIVASDGQPERSAAIANAVADVLVQRIRDDAAALVEPARRDVAAQIGAVEAAIGEVEERLRLLETDSSPGTVAERDALSQELERHRDSLTLLESTKTTLDLQRTISGTEATTWARAAPPTEPAAPRRAVLTVLGALAGLMVAGGGIVLGALRIVPIRTTETSAVGG